MSIEGIVESTEVRYARPCKIVRLHLTVSTCFVPIDEVLHECVIYRERVAFNSIVVLEHDCTDNKWFQRAKNLSTSFLLHYFHFITLSLDLSKYMRYSVNMQRNVYIERRMY